MVDAADIVQSLQHVPLFQELENRHLGKLAKRFVDRHYPAGQAMVIQGQGGEGFFVVISGKAEAVRTRADGEKVVVNTFGPTSFFGEMALLDAGIRTATVTALEPTDCLVLRRGTSSVCSGKMARWRSSSCRSWPSASGSHWIGCSRR